ncbi:MAG: hypothetical protein COU69_02960 [Candidatus Pacebacteria bacterium CG10_big_fil_rev_8_21_14_0_10_56_10]|nr:MAG: hypothetical protein COU69_02960 [Candidatus Pacebacteria bacterium CG10_big_fil_rev_8_21_14_0_10_56_10]
MLTSQARQLGVVCLAAVLLLLSLAGPAQAVEGQVLGVHILHPEELELAKELVAPSSQTSPVLAADNDDNNHNATTSSPDWHYVTIPLPLSELEHPDKWQAFFNQAKELKVIPVVRLATEFRNGAWQVPTRRQIVDQISFLSELDWPTDRRHLVVYNEVNHAAEWGGSTDPAGYADVLNFTSNWAASEPVEYVVMPAALDLAAPNGRHTQEAFSFWRQVLAHRPDALSAIDVWNSHSYPNPGFAASPLNDGRNSLRGFQHELAFIKEQTGRELQVIITETGWKDSLVTRPWLESYYTYALQHIWSDPRVLAVTPFVLRGDPGPFSGFTFLDRHNQPTAHYFALQGALRQLR